MPVSADLGPLASVLERAGRPDADERATAAEFGKGLLQVGPQAAAARAAAAAVVGLFDTPPEQLRSPDDPTGGVVRPGDPAPPLVLVPIDEPSSEPDEPVDTDGLAADLDDDDLPASTLRR